MFCVLEYDAAGAVVAAYGPGDRPSAVASLEKLVVDHCGVLLTAEERKGLLDSTEDEFGTEDGWSWEVRPLPNLPRT